MEESVKLPASSFDEVAKIIASYAKLDKESSLAEISKLTSMHKTKISGNNGFLLPQARPLRLDSACLTFWVACLLRVISGCR